VLNQEIAEVEAVYVRPEAGRQGIGLKLLQQLETRGRALGLSELNLYASLNAVPFYKRAGYLAQQESKYRLSTGLEISCVPMLMSLDSEAGPS